MSSFGSVQEPCAGEDIYKTTDSTHSNAQCDKTTAWAKLCKAMETVLPWVSQINIYWPRIKNI